MHSRGIHMLVLVVAAIGCYAMSLAPVTWVVISEIFPNRIRGAAMSVAVTALWIASFILTYTFPLFNQSLGAAKTFWIYAAICVAGFLFIKARFPETKGRLSSKSRLRGIEYRNNQTLPQNVSHPFFSILFLHCTTNVPLWMLSG